MLYAIVAAALALALSAVLTALLRVPVLRLGVVDRRRQRPVPLSGGAAVVLATGLVACLGDWTGLAPLGDGIDRLLVSAVAVAALGLVADLWRLGTRLLLGGTAVAAVPVVPYAETGFVGGVLAVGWIVFVAVAFKGLDHADGPVGAVGMLAAFGAGACAASEVMDGLAMLLSVLAASLTGFLMHNWPPARAGLGAGGALFVGFLLAGALVVTRAGQGLVPSAGVLFALTAVASADAVLVLLSRRLAGRSLLRRGPDHLVHRLRKLGLTPQGATVLLGLGAGAGVLAGVLVQIGAAGEGRVLWVAAVVAIVVLALLRVPVYGPRRRPRVTSSQVRAQLRVRNG
ncbi:MraY family glycosyltransferase [Streptomyces sp. NPDC005925]|uniref:MraY family glycosyltransferase n=1 Tax=Streptomyces sp. NPDC005925 TaxID=3157172 RepID=UPI0033E88592